MKRLLDKQLKYRMSLEQQFQQTLAEKQTIDIELLLYHRQTDAISRLDEFSQKPNSSIENVPERECDTAISNLTERGSASAVQQRTQENHPINDGITRKMNHRQQNQDLNMVKLRSSDPGSIRKNSSTHRKDAATVIQSYVVSWDVMCIKHPLQIKHFI